MLLDKKNLSLTLMELRSYVETHQLYLCSSGSFALGMENKNLGRKSANPVLIPPSTLDTRAGSVLPSDMHIRNLCWLLA